MNNRNVEYTDKSESLFTAIRKPTPCPTAFSNYNVPKCTYFCLATAAIRPIWKHFEGEKNYAYIQ